MPSTHLPRFRRAAEIPPIALTERDRSIVRRVFEHRFLRSTHILSLTSGSRQQVLRRLQRLFHHGYLHRPPAQLDYYRAGSQPMVYALGNEGMRLLAREDGIPPGRLDWTARNRSITRFFMEHAIAVTDTLVKLELSCRRFGLQWLRPDLDEAVKWTVNLRHNGKSVVTGVVPDAVFGIRDKNGVRWFFLEADRATMPIERNTFKQTSFLRKLLAYYETWRQGLLKECFPRFQVLTVTTTKEHAKNLARAALRVGQGKGARLFLFNHKAGLNRDEEVLALPWLNGRGEEVALWQMMVVPMHRSELGKDQ